MKKRGTVVASALLTLAVSGAAAVAEATGQARNGQIAFVRFVAGSGVQPSMIVVANPDGTAERPITQPPAGFRDDLPDWSPNGSRIVFQRCEVGGGQCRVWSTNPAGTDEKLLGRDDDRSPVYSPDGRQLAVIRENIRPAVLVVADATLKRPRVLALPLVKGSPQAVAWSPNGQKLAVAIVNDSRSAKPAGGRAIYVVNVTKSGWERVTPWTLQAGGRPDWSPDGKLILFRSNTNRLGGFGANLCTVRFNGSGLRQLTKVKSSTRVLDGVFSPDGKSIVFSSSAAAAGPVGQPDLFVMRVDGTGVKPVIRSETWDASPDWGPRR